MGDSLSFAYPEMFKGIYPETFEQMSEATVKVDLVLDGKSRRVYGNITALIRDKIDKKVYSPVLLFTRTKKMGVRACSKLQLQLASSVVAVPSGWVLDVIEVDLYIGTGDSSDQVNNLKSTITFSNNLSQSCSKNGVTVNVKIIPDGKVHFGRDNQHFRLQLSRPVEVEMMRGHPTIVYTIGDELSFTEFIMTLRRILADHPDREDILDGYDLLNLSSTREHPVLAKQRSPQPARWLHVRLQVADEHGKITWWTTLIMRDDTLYVHGLMNQKGSVFELVDNDNRSYGILPARVYHAHPLQWSVAYRTILNAEDQDGATRILLGAHLGRDSAKEAVQILSRYAPGEKEGDDDPARLALVGLIMMVCESARMNPTHDAFAAGWSTGTGFTQELMDLYVWKYGKMSKKLRTWKIGEYAEPHPIWHLQSIHLVLNYPPPKDNGSGGGGHKTRVGGVRGGNNGGCDGGGGGSGGNNRGSGGGGSGGSSSGGGGGGASSSGRGSYGSNGVRGSNNRVSDGSEGGSGSGGGSGGNNRVSDGGGGGSGADENKGNGRALVELLAMHANLEVVGTKIIVFDGKRGQIIYEHEEQEQGGMIDLELTGPYTGISASGPFAIQIDNPEADPITWEWDCYNQDRIDEVDEPPKTEKIGNGIAEVTYAVMSDALEATVEVKLMGLPDGHNHIYVDGEITALIEGFKDKSCLFRRRPEATLWLSGSYGNSWSLLPLARNVIVVPCGKVLHIKLNLQITGTLSKKFEANFTFDNGVPTGVKEDNNVEVKINWYPETKIGTTRSSHQPEQTSEEINEHESVTAQEPRHPAENEMATGQPSHLPEQTSEVTGEQEFTATASKKRSRLAETGMATAEPSKRPKETSEGIREEEYITAAPLNPSRATEKQISDQDFFTTTTTTLKGSCPVENEMATAQPSHLPEQTSEATSEQEFIATASRKGSHQAEDFVVKDCGNEGISLKSYPPYLDKEVWRLEHIERGGDFHERLMQNNVTNVQEFLRMLAAKPDELRAIMGDGMNDSTWEEITSHARTCVVPHDKVYAYRAADADATIYVDSILDLVKVEFSGVECPLKQLDQKQNELVQQIIREAYEHLDQQQEVQQTWRLEFKKQPRLPIHAGSRITDATGNPLEIIVVDAAETGFPRPIPTEMYIKLVPLQGDFPPHEDWSAEEFQAAIVKQRYENVPLLKGDTDIVMTDGRVTVDVLHFTDDPSWVPGRKFRIGACVVPRAGNNNGSGRILEAMTETFVVRNRNRKHYPPELDDPVWRLEMIDRDREVHRKLTSNKVDTVQEFLRMLHVKEDELRELIVGDGMTHRMWLMTIGHAKNCYAGQEVYKYSGADGTIYVDSVFREVFKVEVDGVEYPLHVLDYAQMMILRQLVLEAYKYRHNLQEVDVDMQMKLRYHEGIETSSLLGKNAMDELRLKLLTSEKHALSTLQSETGETFPGSDHRPVDRKRWMAELGPDRVRVHQVVWPGAHRTGLSFGRRQSSVYKQLVTGARVIEVRVPEERRVCDGTLATYPVEVVFDDVKRFLDETECEVVVLEIRTRFGENDPPEFDKFLVEQLGEYLIRQDDAVFNKTIAELLPQRVICVWKPHTSPAPKPGELLWSAGYLRDNWNDTCRSGNKFESPLKFLGQQPPVADRKFFYRVEHTWIPLGDTREYARLFIAHVFAKGLDDKLQVFSTHFINGDFVDACAGVTKARVEGAAEPRKPIDGEVSASISDKLVI